MPTIAGMRRRGYSPAAIRDFCSRVGVTKFESLTDVALLEHCLRDDLNRTSARAMAVIRPLKVVIVNYPGDGEEFFEAVNNPEDPSMGTRRVPFCRELYIERDDFMENPPKKFHRLYPGSEVRLRYACYITCVEVIRDRAGEITELRCTYDPESRGGGTPDGRRVKGTIHWVSARHCVEAEMRLYDRLFVKEDPADGSDGKSFVDHLNPASLEVVKGLIEPALAGAASGSRWQFERLGYFCADNRDTRENRPVFNRTVTLRDSWAKIAGKGGEQ
jgi:glutaminyl-tRNA synthetase